MTKYSTIIIATSIILAALCVALSNRFQPSPVNESLVIDSWTGDIYDIQGNNLTDMHKNIPSPQREIPNQKDKIQ